jgi:group II intron reverse transcriptase/maturase
MELIKQIARAGNLTDACAEVVSNKGSAGVDGMSVKKLKKYLDKNRNAITDQLLKGTYMPLPIRGKEIPKDKHKKRLLGIPSVIDRMLQQSFSRVLMARYEFRFSDKSYAFRPKRNTQQAVLRALEYINAGYQYIVDIDLKTFFDEVDHCLLLQLLYRRIKCRTTLKLIRRWLRAPIQINGKLQKRRKGVPQGSPLSPLLSNILLHELDMEMEKRGLRFIRYADDFSIYCQTQKEARAVGNSVYLFLKNKLRLPINREKSGIRRPLTLSVLGHSFVSQYQKGSRGKYQLVVQSKRWERLKQKLKEVTRKTSPMSFDERIQKLKEISRGWINNFALTSIYQKIKDLDGWVRNRLRKCIWHDWKKPERKRKNLIRLGVDAERAYMWSRTRKGSWAVAQSPIMKTTVTEERLKMRGYESMVDYYLKVCPKYNSPLFGYLA